jgi:hypothetical protein
MKLARPDVFHPRIVLAGCRQLIEGNGDDAGLVPALRRHGLHARWLAWDDPETLRADLVILRATWDYTDRLEEFLAWTRRVKNLLNASDVVAWNTDERYLVDLARAGVPIVAQPGDRDGETALIFLGGEPSHAFTGGHVPKFDITGSPALERLAPADPDFELWDIGVAALHAAAARLGVDAGEFLYARVDVVGRRDNPRLVELELVEPLLGWQQLDPQTRDLQQRQFTLAVESALERLGLGPWSHRRAFDHRRP